MDCPECGKLLEADEYSCRKCGFDRERDVSTEEGRGGKDNPIEGADETMGIPSSPQSTENREHPRNIGKYKVIKEIGKGAMGTVYLAEDPVINRMVAIKTMIAGEVASAGAISRFMTEAKSAGKLQHPGIVGVHEVGRNRALHFMVLDYIKGETLSDLIDKRDLTPRRCAEIIKDAADALHYAHKQGIIHRDIKPANIMLRENGKVSLMDFGLARNLEEDKSLTKTGQIMGTPVYLNPEQARGQVKSVDARSDVYSLGAVFYEMLTGLPPVEGDDLMEIVNRVILDEPEKPTKLNKKIHKDLEIICLKAMYKEPELRYQSAKEFADDLGRWVDGEPILARPASILYKSSKWIRKYKLTFITSAALIILSIGGIWGYGEYIQRKANRLKIESDKRILETNKELTAVQAELTKEKEKEKRSWVAVYSEDFNSRQRLGVEWQTGAAGVIKDDALYIDGTGGNKVVWLKIPIKGEEWKFEYDAWVAEDSPVVKDIGLSVKSPKDYSEGFRIHFGGWDNNKSAVFRNSDNEICYYVKAGTIVAGHRYRFRVMYRDGKLTYTALDMETKEIIVDLEAEVPDIHITIEKQYQGFWTWEAQVYFDNIIISKLGLPEKKDDLVAAEELRDYYGTEVALDYLRKKIDNIEETDKRGKYFAEMMKMALNASIKDRETWTRQLIRYYPDLVRGAIPSEIMSGTLLYDFYGLVLKKGGIDKVEDPELKKILEQDYEIAAFIDSREKDEIRDIFLKGDDFGLNGEHGKARNTYLSVIRKFPDQKKGQAEALRLTAASFEREGNYEKAHEYLVRVFDEFSFEKYECALATLKQGQLYQAQDNIEKALESFEYVLEQYADFSGPGIEALNRIAEIYIHRGEIDRAVETLYRVSDNYPENSKSSSDALLFAGDLLRNEGMLGDALDAYSAVIEDYSEQTSLGARALLAIGDIYRDQGEFDLAADTYGTILQDYKYSRHECVGALVNMGLMRKDQGQIWIAIDCFNRVLEEYEDLEKPFIRALVELSLIYLNNREFARSAALAVAGIQKGEHIRKNHPRILYVLGASFHGSGELDKARKYLNEFLSTAKTDSLLKENARKLLDSLEDGAEKLPEKKEISTVPNP